MKKNLKLFSAILSAITLIGSGTVFAVAQNEPQNQPSDDETETQAVLRHNRMSFVSKERRNAVIEEHRRMLSTRRGTLELFVSTQTHRAMIAGMTTPLPAEELSHDLVDEKFTEFRNRIEEIHISVNDLRAFQNFIRAQMEISMNQSRISAIQWTRDNEAFYRIPFEDRDKVYRFSLLLNTMITNRTFNAIPELSYEYRARCVQYLLGLNPERN